MSQYNIGPRIGIEGEAQFRAQISRINSEYRSMDSYLKAVEKSMEKQGVTQDLLAQKSNAIQRQIALQNKAYAEYSAMLEKIKGLEGDHSDEITRYEGALLHTKNTLNELKFELSATEQAMADLASGVSEIAAATASAESRISEYRQEVSRLNDEFDAAKSYTDAVGRNMATTGRSMEGMANQANGLCRQIDLQQQIFVALQSELREASSLYGDNSAEVLRLSASIENVKYTVSGLERELSKTEKAMDDVAHGIDDVGDSADSAEPKVLSFGDMLKAGIASGAILNRLERVGELTVEIGSKTIEAAADVKAANSQFSQTFGDLKNSATSALKAISKETEISVSRLQGGYTSVFSFAKGIGGDFQQSLDLAGRAMRAAADNAAYMDKSLEQATEQVYSLIKGNYENDAALGTVVTETTRNAKANELYAKSFKELTEVQKVDTLLAIVEASNKASGALGQAAREADSWTNVTGEAEEATRLLLAQLGSPILQGLTPLIQGYTEALKGMTEVKSFQKLAGDVESFTGGVAAAAQELERSNASMDATAGLAGQYVKRLEEIEAAGLNTADAQREYAQTVELLNALMPELDLQINQVTGRLNTNTGAITANIASLRKQAQEQAKQAYYKRIIDESSKAYEALADAQLREAELLARKEQLLANGAQMYDAMSYAQTGSTQAMAAFNASLSAEDQELAAVIQELVILGGEIRNAEGAIAGLETEFETANKALEDYGEGAETAAESAGLLAKAQAELRKAYETAKTAARESIDNQIGLFHEMAKENDWSAEKIIKNWEKQQEAFSKYEENLKKATELGLDEALVQQLSDGSEQSMLILDALVNDTELSVDEINAAFGNLNQAKDSLAGTLAEMEGITSESYARMAEAAKQAGYDTMDGLIAAIYDRTPRLERAMENAARKAPAAFNRTIEIHSPSRVMMRSGQYVIAGAVQGVEMETPKLERAMSAAAQSANDAYLQQQLDAVAQYPSLMAGTPGYGAAGGTTNTRNVAYGGISININTQPGQDAHSIAEVVLEELTVRLGREEVIW